MRAPLGPILVATDFSGYARLAAIRAARLAHEAQSALTLVNVLPDEPLAQIRGWLGAASAVDHSTRDGAQRQLRQLASELARVHRVEVEFEGAAGSALGEIMRTAERVDARLVVLGARGRSVMRRLVLGTTSARLIRRMERPLLVVRQKPLEPYRCVLVAVDFSPCSRSALALARHLAPNAHLLLMTAFQVPFEAKLRFAGVDAETIEIYRRQARTRARQQLHALSREAGLLPSQWDACVVEGDPSLRIVEQARTHGCDLVALGQHGHSTAASLLLDNVTGRVLAEGQADLLVSTNSKD